MNQQNYADFQLTFKTNIIIDKIKNHLADSNSVYIIDDFFYTDFKDLIAVENVFWLNATEKNKSFKTVEKITDFFIKRNVKRSDCIIVIGGGLTLDISAFCASVFKRGCELKFFPTTIIAMLDASVGGKTGLNYKNLKNNIGTFYPAKEVIFDFEFLKTLPAKEFNNGYAELIKTMIIFDRDFFNYDFSFIEKNLSEFIFKAVKYKLQVCETDLSDKGKRQFLNLGHTFAHLFETVSDFTITHGDAVAKGIYYALLLSLKNNLLSQDNFSVILKYLTEFCELKPFTEQQLNRIKSSGERILCSDKKNENVLKLILINNKTVDFFYVNNVVDIVDFIEKNDLNMTSHI